MENHHQLQKFIEVEDGRQTAMSSIKAATLPPVNAQAIFNNKEIGMSSQTNSKPHAVCIPFPAQGHIKPMLKLAKILHHKGFHITVVNTEYNHRRLIKSQGPESVNGLHDLQLKTIPDGLPFTEDIDATQEAAAICESTSKNCLVPFRDIVCSINNQSDLPPVSSIVSDGIMSFTLDVAEEHGIGWNIGMQNFYRF